MITIDQGLRWMQTLKARHSELISLRNQNSHDSTRYFGDREVKIEKPIYDIKKLDKLVNQVAMEMRILDEAIKDTNATTEVKGYDKKIEVLGVIE